jgi:small subunit ribosomal protein S2
MSMLSLANLYQLGVHRGNSKSKLNPKLKNKVHNFKNNLCVIDLVSTIDSINATKDLFKKIGSKKKQILIVGTSSHLSDQVVEFSNLFNSGQMPYVNTRWLGGSLTNWATIRKNLKILEKLENMQSNAEFFAKLARNEQLSISRQIEKMGKFFNGLKLLKSNRPAAVLVLDAANNSIAIKESECVKIPVVALTNTFIQTLPKNLENTILCNNNSVAGIDFIVKSLIESYNEGFASSVEAQAAPKVETK